MKKLIILLFIMNVSQAEVMTGDRITATDFNSKRTKVDLIHETESLNGDTWEGKPIYSKTIVYEGVPSFVQAGLIVSTLDNVDEIIDIDYSFKFRDHGYSFGGGKYATTHICELYVRDHLTEPDVKYVQIFNKSSSWYCQNWKAVVKYTKID